MIIWWTYRQELLGPNLPIDKEVLNLHSLYMACWDPNYQHPYFYVSFFRQLYFHLLEIKQYLFLEIRKYWIFLTKVRISSQRDLKKNKWDTYKKSCFQIFEIFWRLCVFCRIVIVCKITETCNFLLMTVAWEWLKKLNKKWRDLSAIWQTTSYG